MKSREYIALMVLLLFCFVGAYGQQRGRVAELDSDTTYMKLVARNGALAAKDDSLSVVLSHNRQLYRGGGADVEIYRSRVVELEQTLFDLRADKSVVMSQISQIEQRWELDHIELTPHVLTLQVDEKSFASEPTVQVVSSDPARSISQSRFVKANLPTSEYKKLEEAESKEYNVATAVKDYVANYEALALLKEEYGQSASHEVADEILRKHAALDSVNRVAASVIESKWSQIVDSKALAYGVLVELNGNEDLFEREDQLKIRAVQIVDSLSPSTECEVLLCYYAQKLSQVEYEIAVAEELNLSRAVGALSGVRDSMRLSGFNFPPTSIQRASLIQYETIEFPGKTVYSSSKPIPSTKIYKEGVIYRLLLGTYNSKQLPTIFRGAYPLSVQKTKAGTYAYYSGGYQTFSEAEATRKMLLKHGFRRPEVVEWRDGKETNLTRNPRAESSKYRVEIKGVGELSQAVKDVIAAHCADKELLKVSAQSFIIRVFDDQESAVVIRDNLQTADKTLIVSVVAVD
ncbi:MAG: hypothetical protein SNG02_04715 [Rikenellaceae bacterium]